MKIVNTKAGQAYHLAPGTQLEIERPNLFFNDWGEQTLPIDLPDTDLNRQLTAYPDMLANRLKPSTNIDCTIQDGDYFMPCRQAILAAKRNEKISTTFYMNEGSFLSRISDVSLSEIFRDEVIPNITTVQQGIDFCWSLHNNNHPHFAIFPTIIELNGERRLVNRVNRMNEDGVCPLRTTGKLGFYNSYDRRETVGDRIIKLTPGYYISPFIRATYLLKRIFAHLGYTLLDSFLTTSEPFSKMVFVNNTIDSLVNGTVMLSHLVPDCMCNTILEVYRRKFCCEFIPDEVARTVRIEIFNDIIDNKPSIDLTPYLTAHPDISFSKYQQIKLSSEEIITEGDSYDATYEIESKYPEAWYEPADGNYYRTGYIRSELREMVSDGNVPYYAGGSLKAYDIKVPDCCYCRSIFFYPDSDLFIGDYWFVYAPYIGKGRTLNSTISGLPTESQIEDSVSDIVSDNPQQKPILSFVDVTVGFVDKLAFGTNHDSTGKWGYSLLYNGEIGIYEKFYRKLDNLLRNSLYKVDVDLLLPNHLKRSLPVHRKVSLQGVELLINILKYTIGGKSDPVTSQLMTTTLSQPLSTAKPEVDRMTRNTEYKWIVVNQEIVITETEYLAAGCKITESPNYQEEIPAIYPMPPTKAIYDVGETYYHRVFYSYGTGNTHQKTFFRHNISLRPALFSEES